MKYGDVNVTTLCGSCYSGDCDACGGDCDCDEPGCVRDRVRGEGIVKGRTFDRLARGFLVAWVIAALLSIVLVAAIIFVAAHFASKVW
jgi:hypothetical protein